MQHHLPLPPFTFSSAIEKVRIDENTWNTCDPDRVALLYSEDCQWKARGTSLTGRPAIIDYLRGKWDRELDYRMCKELWVSGASRIAVRFAAEWRDDTGGWFRSYGNENWDFDEHGVIRLRYVLVDDLSIQASERKFFWERSDPRPEGQSGLTDMGL